MKERVLFDMGPHGMAGAVVTGIGGRAAYHMAMGLRLINHHLIHSFLLLLL